MKQIKSDANLDADDCLSLYMYYIFNKERKKYNYNDFLPSQSLIDSYNKSFQIFNEEFRTTTGYIKYGKPIDWDYERKKTPLFKKNLLIGAEFERFVEMQFLKCGINIEMFTDSTGQFNGENKFGIEIKYCSADNILFIKYKSCLKYNGNKVNNGVTKEDNTKYWIVGKPSKYYIFYKNDLINIYNRLSAGEIIKGCKFDVSDKNYNNSKCFTMDINKCKEIMITDEINDFVSKYNRGLIK